MGKYSKYKGVTKRFIGGCKTLMECQNDKPWQVAIRQSQYNLNGRWVAFFATEREAAIAYDKKLIELGHEPVNILKRKK